MERRSTTGLTRYVIGMVFESCNFLLHSLGFYLVFTLYRRGEKNVQQLLLVNLSMVQCLYCFVYIVYNAIQLSWDMIRVHGLDKVDRVALDRLHNVKTFFGGILWTSFTYLYYLSMTYISVDRVLRIVLGMRYNSVWNKRKTKILLAVTWFVNVLIIVVVFTMTVLIGWNRIEARFILLVYIPSSISIIYVGY